jgi:hypothetical protein
MTRRPSLSCGRRPLGGWHGRAVTAFVVISRIGPLRPRPINQHREEARHVLNDLPGILAAEIAAKTRLPNLAAHRIRSFFRLSFAARNDFTETSQAVPRRSVLLVSGLGIPPMTLDPKDLLLQASPSQGSPLKPA